MQNITYETFVNKEKASNINPDLNFDIKRFKDGTFIQTKEDYVLFDLQELNVDYEKENFDIEVYLLDDKEKGLPNINEEFLTSLFFEKKETEVINNILIDPVQKDDFSNSVLVSKDPTFVRYWLDLLVDNEIPNDILCKILTDEQKKLLADEFNFDCEDKVQKFPSSRTTSDIKLEDIDPRC